MCRKLDRYCRKRAQPKRELTGFRNSLMIDDHETPPTTQKCHDLGQAREESVWQRGGGLLRTILAIGRWQVGPVGEVSRPMFAE